MRTLTAVLLALAAALVLAFPAQAAYPGKNGRIAYVDSTEPDPEGGPPLYNLGEIWTANPDDTGHRRLTTNTFADGEPTWSPDGKWIAFTSGRTGAPQVFVMRADGSGVRQVTRGPAASSPTWSPDGNLLAFIREGDIWIGTAIGVGAIRLTRTAAVEADPAWSPRGFEIAYTRSGDQLAAHIWTIRITGTHAQDLSARSPLSPDGFDGDYEPAWSPDGKRLIFSTHRGPNTGWAYGTGVWTMRADGGGRTMLADGTYHGGMAEPATSPDGTRWVGTTCLMGHCWLSLFNETTFLSGIGGTNDGETMHDADWQPIPCRPWPLRC